MDDDADSGQTQEADRWFTLELMGGRAGWMHSTTRIADNGDVTTATRMRIQVGRGERSVEVTMETSSTETREGTPLRMKSRQKMGQMVVEKTYTFVDDGASIDIATTQAGRTTTQRVPAPSVPWKMPAAADRYMRERFRAGDKEIRVGVMDPNMGTEVVTSVRTGFTPATIDVDGAKVEALRTQVAMDLAQGVESVEYLDAEGDLIRSETSVGGMAIIMSRSTRAQATRTIDRDATPEVMVRTFISPDRTISQPRRVTRGVYELRAPAGTLPDFATTGTQAFTRIDAASGRLEVSQVPQRSASETDATSEALLASTTMADTSDPRLKGFVERVLREARTTDDSQKAEALRRAVHTHIDEKNLGVGMGTASEVVRTREGDCTEHGVLLAAALRVAGIRSRVATGLIYADRFAGGEDIFGYHMWAQALLKDDGGVWRWVDLDATLPEDTPYDATHLTIATSDLSDADGLDGMLSVAAVLGNLEVRVLEARHADGTDAMGPPPAGHGGGK